MVLEDAQEISADDVGALEKVYNPVTEAIVIEADRLAAEDSSLTKAAIADMLGVKHDELAEALKQHRVKRAEAEAKAAAEAEAKASEE